MKTYLRNEIIITKNAYINQIFKITKGHITNKRKTETYGPKDYLFLDQIFYNPYTLDEYYALDLVAGEWIDKCDIDMNYFPILSKMIQEKKNQTELLLLNDPITKLSRYLYFEYLNNKTESFYITLSISDLSFYLHINKNSLSEVLKYLESKEIISKHNKLFNILNTKKLETLAYQKEFKI
ncbi:MAG: hypothetical protein K2K48_01140 [Anaeroplasmataceae bacterium]|nr:hypothetical protein [Anaeroplasmataceae bacterium]MDE6413995.1 hypothetical protein [Anaeroplasmataceae bacterium]